MTRRAKAHMRRTIETRTFFPSCCVDEATTDNASQLPFFPLTLNFSLVKRDLNDSDELEEREADGKEHWSFCRRYSRKGWLEME